MTTKDKEDGCRLCGGVLLGNHRRWLFAGQKKRPPQSPSDTISKDGRSRSARSSPWGSSLSLSSSHSLSKSQSLSSPSRGVDLLTVLKHIIGKAVPRDSGQGEFLCGKCVSVLERVFKFDTVIARVKVLSSEKLQNLSQERDKIRQWVYSVYRQRNADEWPMKGSTSEDDEGGGTDRGNQEEDGYRDLLKDNMALSEFEFWSEKWKTCPYFRRTGKRCKKGKNCEGCNALRVSDSDYESVCGVPRFLQFQPFSPLPLSRDKSRSMPLHWSRLSSVSSDTASLAGSCLSLQGPSHSESIQSLDSLDGYEAFHWSGEPPVTVGNVLRELKGIIAKPVTSPAGSRIPVRDRKKEGFSVAAGERSGTGVVRVLSFGEGDDEDEVINGESKDVLTELTDEFIPLHRESKGRMHNVVRQLRGQLDQAVARIKTLEADLKVVNGHTAEDASQLAVLEKAGSESVLLQSVANALHCREKVIQDCMTWVQKLCAGVGVEAEAGEKLVEKLRDVLENTRIDNESVFESMLSEQRGTEQRLEREMEALREATRERERDLNMLSTVLQCNQDIISELRLEVSERERAQKEGQREKEVWRQRDQTMTALLQEKEALICFLKEALDSAQRDIQALSDSVIGQGVSGAGAEAALAYQLREKEMLLSRWLKDKEEHGASLLQEVDRLNVSLKDLETLMQTQRESHSQTVSALSAQLKETQKELREREKENKEAKRQWQSEKEQSTAEERKLRENLEMRDKLIQVLLDSEARDQLLAELQQNLLMKVEPRTALKHTL
ncbi:uncharacterized protein LOC108927458 isoform X2 [Scleropages formosus]|uniref:uncharacterized protein LOC108927458 isoform X2 n=1 Tax=Scleropages formosus TaxID=113540 RepID=UPI0008783891|nr:uncharacterized protein LOC108927458 isoform X2 [Scleropages formosus]